MSQISKKILPKSVEVRLLENLWETFGSISNKNEAKIFLFDFLSKTEKVMLAKRLAIAILLKKNYDFRSISDLLKVSTTTVNTIYKLISLNSESYKMLISKYNRGKTTKELFHELESRLIKLHPKNMKKDLGLLKVKLGHRSDAF
ncbi:hypothetical protein HY382_02850 [Candidatus Curtissbacteria bacterium]|nr:hypothetical protein [Candidatus Curtissbacteria bacterium]